MQLSLVCFIICVSLINSALSLHPNWCLAWSDEFDTLDTTKWNIRNRAGNYKELQWYSPSQVSVANGSLIITTEKRNVGGLQYVSARIDSMDKAVFTYGRYEVRAKMVGGKGMWPAMWLLSQDQCWTRGAEIDLAEFRGSYPTKIGTYYHYSNKCCTQLSGCSQRKGVEHTVPWDLTKDYHIYAVEWWPTNMTWFVDDIVVESYQTKDLAYTQDLSPHYWVINNAVGGSYAGTPDNTTVFPNYHYVDYVRNYVWREPSCSGVTCSGKGCCSSTTFLCKCDPGYSGANCEYNLANATNNFDTITNLDNIPNGWGNAFTTYLTKNAVNSSGAIKLTLNATGCPGACGNTPYSSGAWESAPRYTAGTFTWQAMSTKVSGTALSLTAAGEQVQLEQAAFSFLGKNKTWVELWTWTNGWGYKHKEIPLGFDASSAYHTYSMKISATNITWYVDNAQKYVSTEVMPVATRYGAGAYYTAQPEWFGPFSYTGPTSTYVTKFTWAIAPAPKATCP